MKKTVRPKADSLNKTPPLISSVCAGPGRRPGVQTGSNFFLSLTQQLLPHLGVWLLDTEGNFHRKLVAHFTLEVALVDKIARG